MAERLAREFEAERPRLLALATRLLGDVGEAEDAVQTAWLRLTTTDTELDNLAAWLTTVTTRLCLDRLRARVPEPVEGLDEDDDLDSDPADVVVLAEMVGSALEIVLERLTPKERVSFVLHESFAIDFSTVAAILDTSPAAARKLASRARGKIARAETGSETQLPDRVLVDAFLDAAKGGDLPRLLELLAPDAVGGADAEAIAMGTPERLANRERIAELFNGGAKAALPVFIGDRPGAAWVNRGRMMVAFDFTIKAGKIVQITFRADPAVLAQTVLRRGDQRR